jgi:indolepyruvate ferredoxin oxidoreductase beta subunit
MSNNSHLTQHAKQNTYDVYLVGVGGQGVLTIGDLLTEAALQKGVPVNFYPTKGMAQRGGFVKAQIRMGRQMVGPQIPEKGADLVIAMELSEALKAVRFVKPESDFVLYGHVWQPTAVMLGKARYPTFDQVAEQVAEAGAKLHYIDPESRPLYEGAPVPANVYVLGAAVGLTSLRELFDASEMAHIVENRWTRGVERNQLAFQAGLQALNAYVTP